MCPLIEEGVRTRITAIDRDDYVGKELVQTDANGRPVAALDVERLDGSNDRVVFAPTALGSIEGTK